MTRFQSLIFTLWLAITAATGLLLHRAPASPPSLLLTADFHPWWGFLSSALLIGLLGSRGRGVGREAALGRYGICMGAAAVALTGLGARMGFLPLIFHQALLWPFVVLAGFSALKRIF